MQTASPALVSILRSGRADFNARFAAARRIHPELDAAAFSEFLTTAVDVLAQAVEKVRPDRLGEVTMAAYDAALELVGQKLAGPGSRLACIEDAWHRVLPKAASIVASSPGRLIPAVCNAVHQLASTPGANPGHWIETMESFGNRCSDPDMFLKLGQFCGWQAGLAHFRSGAIAAADALDESLALAAVGAKPGSSWATVREQLLANPWFDPRNGTASPNTVRVVAQVGAFKGFGGLFVEPPSVAMTNEQFLVRSDSECWFLTADAFGSTFHRTSVNDFELAQRANQLPTAVQVTGARVVFRGDRFEFPALGEIASAAANETTLALTSRLTHTVVLVALK